MVFTAFMTERPYQDSASGFFGSTGRPIEDLALSNSNFDPYNAKGLYHRYLDEKVYAEEMGFDGIMLNEHHSTPFSMGAVANVEAAILAKITKRIKIAILGNILPIHDNPLRLAEELAIIDCISKGRLVTGWVRGTGRESISYDSQPTFNWDRYQEAHDLIVKTWTDDGPFRWEGEHFQYRYVNPWTRPFQKPHPPIWIPGTTSKTVLKWAAQHRYPYVSFASAHDPIKETFDIYRDYARNEFGFEAGPQHLGIVQRVHVDETEELADATARKFTQGPSNPFLEGNQGIVRPFLQNLPGYMPSKELLPMATNFANAVARGISTPAPVRLNINTATYEEQVAKRVIIKGTPKKVIQDIRWVLEKLQPGIFIFWGGEGAMDASDTRRNLRLLGEEVIPAVKEMAKEMGLNSPFEVDPATNKPVVNVEANAAS